MLITQVDEIIEKHKYDESHLIGVLQDMQAQHENKYLPKDALEYLAQKLNISLSRVYHIATFFKAFSLKPKGRHELVVCLGTACHVRGGQRIVDKLQRELKINLGETTPDLMFTLEAVNCLGCCALGPVVVVDDEYHGQMISVKVDRLLKKIRKKDEEEKKEKAA